MKRILVVVLSLIIIVSASFSAFADTNVLSEDIVILYTNDVHTYIDGVLSYDTISAIKTELGKKYKYVFLADAGDHIQGTAYGSMDKGESIIELMNRAGYDVATLGNHEFDYNMSGCLKAVELAEFPYVSANFYHEEKGGRGKNVLPGYVTFDCGDEKLAVIGITTPETFSKSTPAYFQNDKGEFIYGISAGDDGTFLQADLQKNIDDAKGEGATLIVALGHLGTDVSSKPWTSTETIAATEGLDAFIDGHSHTVTKGDRVKDKKENDVILTQTGSYFDRIGMMIIDTDTHEITTDFIEYEEILSSDGKKPEGYRLVSGFYEGNEIISEGKVKEIKNSWINEVDKKLGEKIGTTDIVFDNYDSHGNRLVRSGETNSGDFAADALYYLFDNLDYAVDVAITNGGGIRNNALTGDISYKVLKDMHTFGNVACLQTVTGQQLLDALEWGARHVGEGENGGFLHTSGITYKIDTSIPDTTEENDVGTWISGPLKYRVHSVMIYNKDTDCYEPLKLNSTYNLAGYNYTLRDLGDGYGMFEGCVNIIDYVMEDYMVLANYVKGFENGIVGATNSPIVKKHPGFILDYTEVEGCGRIEIEENSKAEEFSDMLWVGSVKVTSENMNDVLSDGGSVSYDPHTDTLTLRDATIVNEKGHGIYAVGINLTVCGVDTEKEGKNDISGKSVTIKGIDEEGYEYSYTEPGMGIFSEGDGYGGNGGLIISGSIGKVSADSGDGISAYEDVVIKGNVEGVYCTGGISCGISSSFGSVMLDGSVKEIVSQEYNAISADKGVSVSGNLGSVKGEYAGIHVTSGDVDIDGSIDNIRGNVSGIEAYCNVDWDDEGNEVRNGGNVTIKGNAGVIEGEYLGVFAQGNLDISGSALISATVQDEDKGALYVEGGIVTVPEGLSVCPVLFGTYEDENGMVEVWHNSLCNSEGTLLSSVKFEGFINPFEDVNEAHWFFGDVAFTVGKGLFAGTSQTSFDPNVNLTRGMLVTVLYRNEGEPSADKSISFEDVDMDAYYASAVSWAKQNGIVSGVSENEFEPDLNITREQIAAIIHRYAIYKGYDVSVGENTNILSYEDFEDISEFAIAPLQYASGMGLIKGKTPKSLNPKDNATRAETAAILHRFMKAY